MNSNDEKIKVLLTGGAGYIGIHTAVELENAGYSVIIADNYYNSSKKAVTRAEELIGHKMPLYNIDVADRKMLDNLFQIEKPDAVIHFAGYKAVGESTKIPIAYYRNNIDTTLTLLETMAKYGTNNIIFSSSATVYGSPKKVPITEDDGKGICSNPYGWTKWMIEQIITDAAAANRTLSSVLLRYFNPVGAHQSGRIGEMPNGIPNNLMPFITQVAIGKREKLNVFGNDYPTHDGTGVRDYIHIVDLACGHVKALEYCVKHKGVEVFNLGTGVGYSVLDMVNTFERVNGVKIPYDVVERRPGDIAECYADPKKAKEGLGWSAKYSLEDMCRDSWRWQQSNPHGYDD